jgi:hypothetical protein
MDVIARYPTGSAYTCDPPVLTTDEDWLVLVDDLVRAEVKLLHAGWVHCLDEARYPKGEDNWFAVRNGPINYMVTDDALWYVRAVAATELCRTLNLLGRDARVAIFAAVRDGDITQLTSFPSSTSIER